MSVCATRRFCNPTSDSYGTVILMLDENSALVIILLNKQNGLGGQGVPREVSRFIRNLCFRDRKVTCPVLPLTGRIKKVSSPVLPLTSWVKKVSGKMKRVSGTVLPLTSWMKKVSSPVLLLTGRMKKVTGTVLLLTCKAPPPSSNPGRS